VPDDLKIAAIGESFEWRGRMWTLTPVGPGARARMNSALRRRYLSAGLELCAILPAVEAAAERDRVLCGIAAGHADIGGAIGLSILGAPGRWTPAGLAIQLLGLLWVKHRDITEEQAESMLSDVWDAAEKAAAESPDAPDAARQQAINRSPLFMALALVNDPNRAAPEPAMPTPTSRG
jgi:hypothetical protein